MWAVGAVAAAGTLLALAPAVGALATISPPVAAAAGFGALFFLISYRSPSIGLALLVPVMLFELGIYAGGDVTFVRFGGAALALACLLRALTRRGSMPLLVTAHPLLTLSAFAFVAVSFASMVWAFDADTAQASSIRLAQNVVLMFVAFTAIADLTALWRVVAAFVIGSVFPAAVGIARGTGPSAGERLRGGGIDPNELAAVLVSAIALAAFVVLATRRSSIRVVAVMCVLGLTAGLFATQSRGGLVALAVALVAAIWLSPRKRIYTTALAIGVFVVGLGYFKYAATPEQVERITHFSTDRGSGRLDIWTVARDVVNDHPIVGVGAGNFRAVEPGYAVHSFNIFNVQVTVVDPRVVHNTYLEVVAELGVVGGIAFLTTLAGAVATLVSGIRASRALGLAQLELLSRGILVATIGMLVAFLFISAQYEKQLWLLLGIGLAVRTVVARARRVPEREAPRVDVLAPAAAT